MKAAGFVLVFALLLFGAEGSSLAGSLEDLGRFLDFEDPSIEVVGISLSRQISVYVDKEELEEEKESKME